MRHLPDRSTVQWAGLVLGPLAAAAVYALLPATFRDAAGREVAFGHAGRATAAVGVWMALWWLTEAIDVASTALLPIALFPLLGVRTIAQTTAPYANDLIFLFLGGFLLALSMERWGLHRRIALVTIRLVGTGPQRIVAGFMVATAILSMWVSNTATALLLLPVGRSVVSLVLGDRRAGEATAPETNFATCIYLGIAYAASIGGVGTIIGSPPNLFLVSYVRQNLGEEIGFGRWLALGLPIVVVFLPIAWFLLVRVLYPFRLEGSSTLDGLTRRELERLGPMSRGEWATFVVFTLAALGWILRPLVAGLELGGVRVLAGLTDAGIAILASMVLFAFPVDRRRRVFVLDWNTAAGLPWGILVLFGGGLSLAAAIEANGVGDLLGNAVGGLAAVPEVVLVAAVTALVIFLTELTSNTATTATLVPILAGLAPALGVHPYRLVFPAAIAASCAFMLPVATPPNAIVFSTGYVPIGRMVRAGFWLNLVGIAIVTAAVHAWMGGAGS